MTCSQSLEDSKKSWQNRQKIPEAPTEDQPQQSEPLTAKGVEDSGEQDMQIDEAEVQNESTESISG